MTVDPTAIIKTAETVSKNSAIAHSLSDGWNALLGDRIANFRLRQAAKIQEKTIAEFDRLGLKPNLDKIPERFAITWFEEATKQDEPEIQELFARLIAKAAAGDEDALDRRNIEIISKLTPTDAQIFYELAPKLLKYYRGVGEYFLYTMLRNIEHVTYKKSIQQLYTIGVFKEVIVSEDETRINYNENDDDYTDTIVTKVGSVIIITETGKSVFNAVKSEDIKN